MCVCVWVSMHLKPHPRETKREREREREDLLADALVLEEAGGHEGVMLVCEHLPSGVVELVEGGIQPFFQPPLLLLVPRLRRVPLQPQPPHLLLQRPHILQQIITPLLLLPLLVLVLVVVVSAGPRCGCPW